MSLNIYVPRDERFGHLKLSDFLAYALKAVGQFLKPELESLFDSTPSEFDSFKDVLQLYEGGIKLPDGLLKDIRDNIPAEMLKEVFPTDGEGLLKYPMPQVIKGIITFSMAQPFFGDRFKSLQMYYSSNSIYFNLNCCVSLTWSRR